MEVYDSSAIAVEVGEPTSAIAEWKLVKYFFNTLKYFETFCIFLGIYVINANKNSVPGFGLGSCIRLRVYIVNCPTKTYC